MLSIFADALLIAARGTPLAPAEPRRKVNLATERKARRRWLSLVGLRDQVIDPGV